MRKATIFYLIIFWGVFKTMAQNLPNKQEQSLWIPDNVKIDGKASEWDNRFQAYNHATDIFYTIANNQDDLYLTVQAVDKYIINKIYSSGLTFSVSPSAGKNKGGKITITYPVWDKNDKFHVNTANKPPIIPGSASSVVKADSFMNATNQIMAAKSKWIMITGVKGIDTLISVYNEYGIKTAALFDNKMVYTLELCLPLKYLDISIKDTEKISYHIQLNALIGGVDNAAKTMEQGADGKMYPHITLSEPVHLGNSNEMARFHTISSTTDFVGEYTLAKK